jgi:hypothetical protein
MLGKVPEEISAVKRLIESAFIPTFCKEAVLIPSDRSGGWVVDLLF